MTKRESLPKQIDQVPDSVLDEVADFVQLLRARIARDAMATAVASVETAARRFHAMKEV